MKSPFRWIDDAAQPRVLLVLTVLLVATSACLVYLDQSLRTGAAPGGIVDFELARTYERSRDILDSWSSDAKATALFLQGFDFLYLFVYPAWFSLACVRVGGRLAGRWARVGTALAWALPVSGAFDAVENYALVAQIFRGPSESLAGLAWGCAVPKFLLVFAAALYLAAGGVVFVVARRKSRSGE